MPTTKRKVQAKKASGNRKNRSSSQTRGNSRHGSAKPGRGKGPHGNGIPTIGTAGRYPVIKKWKYNSSETNISFGNGYEGSTYPILSLKKTIETIEWLYPLLCKNKQFKLLGDFSEDLDPNIFLEKMYKTYSKDILSDDTFLYIDIQDKTASIFEHVSELMAFRRRFFICRRQF